MPFPGQYNAYGRWATAHAEQGEPAIAAWESRSNLVNLMLSATFPRSGPRPPLHTRHALSGPPVTVDVVALALMRGGRSAPKEGGREDGHGRCRFSLAGKCVVITDVGDGDTIDSTALLQRRLHALLSDPRLTQKCSRVVRGRREARVARTTCLGGPDACCVVTRGRG